MDRANKVAYIETDKSIKEIRDIYRLCGNMSVGVSSVKPGIHPYMRI